MTLYRCIMFRRNLKFMKCVSANNAVNSELTSLIRQYHKVKADKSFNSYFPWIAIVAAGITSSTGVLWYLSGDETVNNKSHRDKKIIIAGERIHGLPTFTAEEVSKHNTSNNFWVIYKDGVYDLTKFLPSHPGGKEIYNAAGHAIDPFWDVYKQHHKQDIYELLESYRVAFTMTDL